MFDLVLVRICKLANSIGNNVVAELIFFYINLVLSIYLRHVKLKQQIKDERTRWEFFKFSPIVFLWKPIGAIHFLQIFDAFVLDIEFVFEIE